MPRCALLLALLAAVLIGCAGARPEGCTEIGCSDGLFVQVSPGAPWPHGSYRFVVEADGVITTCTGALPLTDCSARAIACDREGVMITESGCALSPDQHAFGDLQLSSTPESISIEVQQGDRTIGRQTFRPTYQTSQPNGPGCDPICTNATVTLPLSFE